MPAGCLDATAAIIQTHLTELTGVHSFGGAKIASAILTAIPAERLAQALPAAEAIRTRVAAEKRKTVYRVLVRILRLHGCADAEARLRRFRFLRRRQRRRRRLRHLNGPLRRTTA